MISSGAGAQLARSRQCIVIVGPVRLLRIGAYLHSLVRGMVRAERYAPRSAEMGRYVISAALPLSHAHRRALTLPVVHLLLLALRQGLLAICAGDFQPLQ